MQTYVVTAVLSILLGLWCGVYLGIVYGHHPQMAAVPGKILPSPTAVVRWLGGPLSAAEWAGVDPEEIKYWYEEIPTGYQHRLYLQARSEGYWITPGAYGLRSNGRPYWPLDAFANRDKAVSP